MLFLSGALAAQPVTVGPDPNADPWPADLVPTLEAAVAKCVAVEPWVGTLEVAARYPEPGGVSVSATPYASGVTDCVEAALTTGALAQAESWFGAVATVAVDPAWMASVTVQGATGALTDAVRMRFGRCAARERLDVTHAVDVEVLRVPGYDAPIAALRPTGASPASPAADTVARCATDTYVEVAGLVLGASSMTVRVATAPAKRPTVSLTPTEPAPPPAAAAAIERLLADCSALHGFTGSFGYFLNVHGSSRSAGTINADLPEAMQSCLTQSMPFGAPDGDWTVNATVR